MKLTVDFSKNMGAVKPMHAVNNGPLTPNVRGTSNHELYASPGIPYARNHDASFSTATLWRKPRRFMDEHLKTALAKIRFFKTVFGGLAIPWVTRA